MAKSYKVWIELEEIDSKGDAKEGGDIGILPDCVGWFAGRKAKAMALARIASIVNAHGIDPENSDSVVIMKKALEKREKTLAKRLENGKTLMEG